MINATDLLISKFRININDIINNTDHTAEDVWNEAYIIVHENYDEIKADEKVFIRKLRNKCLKFNKYGKKINSSKEWSRFNMYEEQMFGEYTNNFEIKEDIICGIEDIKKIVNEKEYEFLLYYYEYGGKETSEKYKISQVATRKRVYSLVAKLRKEMI